MKLLTWLVALALGSLTVTGALNVYPFRGASAIGAIVVGISLGALVSASVVTAAQQVLRTERRSRVHA